MTTKNTFNWSRLAYALPDRDVAARRAVDFMASDTAKDIGDTITGKAPGPDGWHDLIDEYIGDRIAIARALGMDEYFMQRVETLVANVYGERYEKRGRDTVLVQEHFKLMWPNGRKFER